MKKLICILLAALLIASLAACGGGDSQSGGSTADNPSGKLVVQSWQLGIGPFQGQTDGQAAYSAFADYFMEFYPDIEAEIVHVAYTDHFNRLKVDFASDIGPDVIGLQTGAPLSEFKSYLADMEPLALRDMGDGWRDIFVGGALDGLDIEGIGFVGFPNFLSFAGQMWYAGTMLDSAGVSAPPKDFNELKDAAHKLRDAGYLPMIIGAKEDWINLDCFMVIASDFDRKNLYDAIEGDASWTTPEMIGAFNMFQKLFEEGIFQDGALGVNVYMEGYSLWADDDGHGLGGLHINGSWEMGASSYNNPNYDTYISYDRGVARFPDMNGDGKPCPMTAAPDAIYCITSVSNNVEAAWAFIRFLVNEEGMQVSADAMSGFPANKNFSPQIEMSPELKKVFDTISELAAGDGVAGYREIAYPELKQALADQLQLLAASATTPEDAAAAVQSASDAQSR